MKWYKGLKQLQAGYRCSREAPLDRPIPDKCVLGMLHESLDALYLTSLRRMKGLNAVLVRLDRDCRRLLYLALSPRSASRYLFTLAKSRQPMSSFKAVTKAEQRCVEPKRVNAIVRSLFETAKPHHRLESGDTAGDW